MDENWKVLIFGRQRAQTAALLTEQGKPDAANILPFKSHAAVREARNTLPSWEMYDNFGGIVGQYIWAFCEVTKREESGTISLDLVIFLLAEVCLLVTCV